MARFKLTTSRGVLLYLVASLAALLAVMGTDSNQLRCGASAATNPFVPGNYCWFFDTDVTNNSGSDATDFMARVELNAAGFIASQQLDPEAWTLYSQTGSYTNAVQTMAQDLGEVQSHWWIQVPSIPDGTTRSLRTYFKNANQQRDQGIYFTGNESATIPDNATLDAGDAFAISATIQLTDDTPRTEVILEKYNSSFNGGYMLGLEDVAGVLNLVFYTNGDSSSSTGQCFAPWNALWTDERIHFSAVSEVNGSGTVDAIIRVDGINQTVCNTRATQGVFANAEDLIIGNTNGGTVTSLGFGPLTGAYVHNVQLESTYPLSPFPPTAPVTELLVQFNPDGLAETTAVDPTYTGTVADSSSNGFNGTYSFTRSQAGFTVDNGLPQLVSGGTPAQVAGDLPAVSGSPIDSDIFNTGENTNLLGYGFLVGTVDAMRWSRPATWSLLFLLPAIMLGALLAAMFRNAISFVVGAGMPYAYAVSGGLIPEYFLLVWGLAAAAAIGFQQWQKQS